MNALAKFLASPPAHRQELYERVMTKVAGQQAAVVRKAQARARYERQYARRKGKQPMRTTGRASRSVAPLPEGVRMSAEQLKEGCTLQPLSSLEAHKKRLTPPRQQESIWPPHQGKQEMARRVRRGW